MFVEQASILITEVTFVDDGSERDKCRKRGHIHVRDIVENLHLFARVQVRTSRDGHYQGG